MVCNRIWSLFPVLLVHLSILPSVVVIDWLKIILINVLIFFRVVVSQGQSLADLCWDSQSNLLLTQVQLYQHFQLNLDQLEQSCVLYNPFILPSASNSRQNLTATLPTARTIRGMSDWWDHLGVYCIHCYPNYHHNQVHCPNVQINIIICIMH